MKILQVLKTRVWAALAELTDPTWITQEKRFVVVVGVRELTGGANWISKLPQKMSCRRKCLIRLTMVLPVIGQARTQVYSYPTSSLNRGSEGTNTLKSHCTVAGLAPNQGSPPLPIQWLELDAELILSDSPYHYFFVCFFLTLLCPFFGEEIPYRWSKSGFIEPCTSFSFRLILSVYGWVISISKPIWNLSFFLCPSCPITERKNSSEQPASVWLRIWALELDCSGLNPCSAT